MLGLAVRRISFRDGAAITDVALDHPDLCQGWWDVEQHGETMLRWTNGDAVLPIAGKGMRFLEITAGRLAAYVARDQPGAAKVAPREGNWPTPLRVARTA
jgi:hypothetical protein